LSWSKQYQLAFFASQETPRDDLSEMLRISLKSEERKWTRSVP